MVEIGVLVWVRTMVREAVFVEQAVAVDGVRRQLAISSIVEVHEAIPFQKERRLHGVCLYYVRPYRKRSRRYVPMVKLPGKSDRF